MNTYNIIIHRNETSEENKSYVFNKNDELAIYKDDSIETIKKKILLKVFENNNEDKFSFEEMYLFGEKKMILETNKLYKVLSDNNKNVITYEKVEEFFKNIKNIDEDDLKILESFKIKDEITYDDLLVFDGKHYIKYYTIGQKITNNNKKEFFIVHPFTLKEMIIKNEYNLGEKHFDIQTTNKYLYFEDMSEFDDNTEDINLHLVLVKDILRDMNKDNLSFNETELIKKYYPLLFNKNITTLDNLDSIEIKERLLENTKKIIGINDGAENVFKLINSNVKLMRDIYKNKKYNLNYIENGVQTLECVLKSNDNIIIPLEFIFKTIHSTEKIPLIQYYPGKLKEKLYRLYSNEESLDGRKIPFLKKKDINKLKSMSEFKKVNSITFYLNVTVNKMIFPIICQLDDRNNIFVYLTNLKIIKTLDEISEIVKENVNNLIDDINIIIQQYGYEIQYFHNFYKENVEITNIQYKIKHAYKKKLNTRKWVGCLSSIFNIEKTIKNTEKEGFFRYTRISNYNEMNSIEAFIIDTIKDKSDEITSESLVQNLMDNFKISEKDANEKINTVLENIQIIEQKRNKFKIKSFPGFPCRIIINEPITTENTLNIMISNIDNVNYIKYIKLYIDSFIRITQDIESTNVSKEEIEELCKRKISKKKEKSIQDVDVEEVDESEQRDDGDDIDMDDIDVDDIDVDDIDVDDIDMDDIDMDDIDVDDIDMDENMQIGGNESKNVTGMKPNIFPIRLKKRDPVLFSISKDGKYKAYSRSCPTNRLPVSLTQKEKDIIDEKSPDSYSGAFKYGSDKDKQHWYICPKYWDLKNNISLTEKEVEKIGKDKIIPKNAKTVPEGKYIYEFYRDNQNYPGFIKGSTKEGLCMPCCFKKWNKKRLTKCGIDDNNQMKEENMLDYENDVDIEEKDIDKKDIDKKDIDKKGKINDILTYNIHPIDQHRFGYIPPVLQYFLQIDNKKCERSADKKSKLKLRVPCLLRKGVEYSEKQSFIACIADAYSDDLANVMNIHDMKEYLIGILDIDLFSDYQNGNLIELFTPKDIDFSTMNDTNININDYRNSRLYKRLFDVQHIQHVSDNITDNIMEKNKQFFFQVIISMNQFINYLRDDTVVIDHSYIWDMVCNPNTFLFQKGLNLIIIDIGNDNDAKQASIICPNNSFSKTQLYDKTKPCLLLMKKNGFYEPLYEFEDQDNKYILKKTFYLEKEIMEELKNTLQVIIKNQNKKCKPKVVKNIYDYKIALNCNETIEILLKIDYDVLNTVYDNNKVIGIVCRDKNNNIGYVPCYQSILDKEYIEKYSDIDVNNIDYLLNNYKDTIDFLRNVKSKSQGQIKTKVLFKVIEDEMIVGVVTETNNFVQLKEPEINYPDNEENKEIETYSSYNYNPRQLNIMIENNYNNGLKDSKRIQAIKRIKLEKEFYNAFRNTVRYVLNTMLYMKEKKEIESLAESKVNSNNITESQTLLSNYNKKISLISNILRKIVLEKYIAFENYNTDLIEETINNCFNIKTCDKKPFCYTKDDNGNCILKIPKNNLLYNIDNEQMYFTKMADELLRYKRIKEFILKPNVLLSFSNKNYDIHKNEILILNSYLNDYFDKLLYVNYGKYVSYNVYDFIQPQKSRYSNKVENYTSDVQSTIDKKEDVSFIKDYTKQIELINQLKNCLVIKKKDKNLYLSGEWMKEFPKKTVQLKINNTSTCTFLLMRIMIFYHSGEDASIDSIKQILLNKYKNIDRDGLVELLVRDEKIKFKKSIVENKITIDDMIMNEEYYITLMDIVTIVSHYKLPVILIKSKPFIENAEKMLVFNSKKENLKTTRFFIVKMDTPKKNKVPFLHLLRLKDEKEEFKIDSNRFSEKIQKEIYKDEFILDIEKYYTPSIKKKKKRLKLEK